MGPSYKIPAFREPKKYPKALQKEHGEKAYLTDIPLALLIKIELDGSQVFF